MSGHLVVAPIVLPLVAGAAMLFIDEERRTLKSAISVATLAALVGIALMLVRMSSAAAAPVYELGAWRAPFGIVLVADRLACGMVLLASILGLAAMTFSIARWQRAGARFHAQVMFLLMGVNGAFLTGDIFNLFVFFELLLAASYGLALHGSGVNRVGASLHYIVINLAASLLFLVGISLVYGVTGTLNMAHLAERIARIDSADLVLAESGVALLSVAFLVKAGMWPLCFWLPSTYAASSAPAAALFTILSKVGIYAVARLWLLLFGGGVGGELLLMGGLATMGFGAAAMLSSQDLPRMAASSLLVSSGTLLAALSRGSEAATSAAFFYLFISTLGIAAFFLLIELVQRMRPASADLLAVTAEAFNIRLTQEEVEAEPGRGIPGATVVLAVCFIGCAALVAGVPPLAGFLSKAAILASVLHAAGEPAAWAIAAMLTLSGLASVVALGRVGVRIFWATPSSRVPSVRPVEIVPVVALLAVCLALTVAAGPAMRFAAEAAHALHEPRLYIDAVLRR
jgi:multicomponent K+:H+ antiporter subunit D